jgi:hypothetical protein
MNALSGFDWMRSGGAHYSALLVPVLLWAAAHGALPARWAKAAPVVVLLSAVLAYAWAGALPLPPEPDPRSTAVRAALAQIPPDAPVSASSGLVPHVSARSHAAWFPAGVDAAEWIALDALGATHPLTLGETRARADELVPTGEFGVVAAEHGLVLLRRGAPAGFSLDSATTLPDAGEPSVALFGHSLELVQHRLRRWPEAGLFGDSATLDTTWRVTVPVADDLAFALATTRRSDGALVGLEPDTPWLPTSRWRPGQLVRLSFRAERLGRYEALGVAVIDPTGRRLAVQSDLTKWDGTILRLAGV